MAEVTNKLDVDKVRALCDSALKSIPLCSKCVEDIDSYMERVCFADTMLNGDERNADNVKRAFSF